MARIPEVVPSNCGECKHFEVLGAGAESDYCRFYQRNTSADATCFALEVDPEAAIATAPDTLGEAKQRARESHGVLGEETINGLGGVAWFVLTIHVLAAIVWWVVGDTFGIALAIGLLVQGIVLAAILRGLYWIGRNVIELRRERDGGAP